MVQSRTKFTVLSARRGYEFEVDTLRLTALIAPQIFQAITAAFQFQTSLVAAPAETFGTVTNTLPPGLVFDMGIALGSEGTSIPIRFLHFEQKRIVIDVAASSAFLDTVYRQLLDVVKNAAAPAPSPITGEPVTVLEFSEITGVFPFELKDLIAPQAFGVFQDEVDGTAKGSDISLLPAIFIRPQAPTIEFSGMTNPPLDSRTFQLAPRAGSLPGQRISYSGAPLDSTAHLRYLETLAETIGKAKTHSVVSKGIRH